MISSYPSAFGSSGAAEAPRPGRPLETQNRVLNQAAGESSNWSWQESLAGKQTSLDPITTAG